MEEPEELTYWLLQEITDGFSEDRKVGEGAFGTVYRGVTKCGEDVAVKILRDGIHDLDYRQFQNEFYNLMKVKHNNIVQVLGYCYEIEPIHTEYHGRIVFAEKIHKALCFEYLHNGNLGNHLSDESCGLDWHTRYKIIKGTCEGLRYIHEGLEESLLHLDIKPENILLDKNMVPKIADFGLSRIFGDKLTRTTQSPLGSLGYQPPEYIERGEVSKKFDIYSLGVVIIRIVAGQKGYFKYQDMTSDEFIDHVQRNWRKRWQSTFKSGFLLEACRQVQICTKIALNCLENDSEKRPDIVKIIHKLNKTETDNNQPPHEGCKTVCARTMHNAMKAKEHKVIADQHQHSNFMTGSRSYEIESGKSEDTSLDAGNELIFGRDKEKKIIMASLFESMSEKMVILPIYGIGGIGKTTFAKLIYNDSNFKYYTHIWVYVSPRFDLDKIGKSIVSQLSGTENQANELQLISKKILIVLDDLWEDNTFQLEDLKKKLNLGDRMAKTIVLVTTRSEQIARKICSNIGPYNIESLADETCWDIIKQKSGFEARHDKERFVGVGKEIARKCGGVALAAQTLGSMLQPFKYDQWIIVKDSDIWNETISKDECLPNHVLASLKLSYVSMDDRLKSCFTYCAFFPKGHKIVKYDLIHQWISLGFIKPTKLFSTLQLCEKYIVQLLGLAFLQHSMSPKTYGTCGEYGTVFTMHDLVHDLAISVLGDKILDQSKQGNTGGSTCCYGLLIDCSKPLDSCTASPARLSALRFLVCPVINKLHGAAFELAESLKILDLSGCSIHKLPDSIGGLKQLRYLNAPRIQDRMVPECIAKLSNLRYLSLHGSWAILTLPESIGEMEGLVHLDLSGCVGIEKLPGSFGNLKSLEHVDFTNCGKISGISQCLATLTKLQYLNLSNCKNIGYLPKALSRLRELHYLNLSNSSYISGNKYLNQSSSGQLRIIRLPEALGSLTELKYLNLSHQFTEGKLPASFSNNLCNLVHLDLSGCSFLQDVAAALNGLTKLQYLDLYKCSSLNAMDGLHEAFGNLSELRHLNLGSCIINIACSHRAQINGLLEQICTLTKLEYLNLCRNDNIYSIPETLANLRMLHTLDVSWCGSLQRLPASIFEIERLKLLHTTGCWKLDRSTLPRCVSSSKNSPYFVVHTDDGESSSNSFQFKYEIHNRLKISRLENVKSEKEAQTIKLVEKTDITGLALEWTRDAKRFVDDAEVLRELEPPYNISKFRLQGYNSFSFPSWMMHLGACLPGLTRIEMSDLPSCKRLPPLGQLPNLELLDIRQMDNIKKIDTDLYGGTRAFPRLKHFRIDVMKCLEEWNTAYSSDEDGLYEPVFPFLTYVSIRDCPRLRFEPRPPRSIHELRVESSDEVMLSSGGDRGHLECGVIPLHRWSDLTSLRTLTVRGCHNIVSLPERLGDPTSLSELEIADCKRIKTLPDSIGELIHLRRLKIDNCRGIKTLPDTIQKLIHLKVLEIFGCPGLVQWCESWKNTAKLAHIAYINYDRY
ncbi:unnamed protein product [Urochloa decumbens]|uniref:Protein kinase domain-containing protein n=2 Tax=Urochloa decumbens TaxID=240449 RepID=A0ABC9GB82_9POAL